MRAEAHHRLGVKLVATLVWTGLRHEIACPVCRFGGEAREVLTVSGASPDTLHVVRCPNCGSVVIEGEMFAIDAPDAVVDGYVENGAGIEAIARNLFYTDPSTVNSFLDVGSNYGFAADLGRNLLGWEVTAIEPGTAGRRGSRELQLAIRDEFLLVDTVFDHQFDLVLASEVLEHVPDPAGFLRAIAAHVAPGGRFVMTTPAAEIVDPSEDETEIIIALSPGYHVFLSSAAGLEQLLREAGFASILVERDHRTLRAIAAVEADAALSLGDFGPDLASIEAYYDRLASTAPRGSALASGMATRHFRALVNRGAFDLAATSMERAAAQIQARHGVDIHEPVKAREAIAAGGQVPWNIIPAAYSAGMMKFLGEADFTSAIEYFDLTLTAADRWGIQAQVLDGDSADLAVNAARHRALIFARFAPERVEAAIELLATLDTPELTDFWAAKVYAELLASGFRDAGEGLRQRVSDFVLGNHGDPSVSREDSALRSAVLPQLFESTRNDYLLALRRREFERASTIGHRLVAISRLVQAPSLRGRALIRVLPHPRLARVLLRPRVTA